MTSPIDIAQQGYDTWAEKPHNRKWVRKIVGTPIPNDLVVCIAEAIKSALSHGPVVVSDEGLQWIMTGALAPTDDEVRHAAYKWCGDKDRETFMSDVTYFIANWQALDGLKAYVAREVAERAKLASNRIAALLALAQEKERECATEGCDEHATYHFDRGGVGSHYCQDCFGKVIEATAARAADIEKALGEAVDVLDGMNDDETNEELLPRLRKALSKNGEGA